MCKMVQIIAYHFNPSGFLFLYCFLQLYFEKVVKKYILLGKHFIVRILFVVPFFLNVTYRIRPITGLLITRETRRVPHVEKDLPTLPDPLRSPQFFGGVRVAQSLVFYVVFYALVFVHWSFPIFSHSVVGLFSIFF